MRHASTIVPSMQWSPVVPKKSLRPIKLSHFTLTAKRITSSQPSPPKPAEHFQTFTLVKHDKSKFANNLRSWQPTMNHIALPLGNQTRFLDDDDEEDDDNLDIDSEPEVKNQGSDDDEDDATPAPKPKSKIRKNFSLGHESWPNDFAHDDDSSHQEPSHYQATHRPKRPKERVELRVEPYVWSVILSECSRTCGQGIRTVRVVCTVGQKTVDDRFCDGEQKPIHKRIEPCKERDCVGR